MELPSSFEKAGYADDACLKMLVRCVDLCTVINAVAERRPDADEGQGGMDIVRQQYERHLGGAGRRAVQEKWS